MKAIAVFATIAAVASSVQASSCATAPIQFALTSYTSTPSPPCIGEKLCFSVSGTLSAPVVEGAKLAVTGRYLNRLVYTDNHDLCKLLADQGTPCPLPITTTDATVCISVKPNAPPNVGADVRVVATNGDGGLLWCELTKGVKLSNC